MQINLKNLIYPVKFTQVKKITRVQVTVIFFAAYVFKSANHLHCGIIYIEKYVFKMVQNAECKRLLRFRDRLLVLGLLLFLGCDLIRDVSCIVVDYFTF